MGKKGKMAKKKKSVKKKPAKKPQIYLILKNNSLNILILLFLIINS